MAWFWPVMGVLAMLLIVLAWLSDRTAKRRGLNATPGDIARNLREAKRERRHRVMILRRNWVPTDNRSKEERPPWRNP
jgi:hypothetical protein